MVRPRLRALGSIPLACLALVGALALSGCVAQPATSGSSTAADLSRVPTSGAEQHKEYPGRTTPVPAPSGGDVHRKVPSAKPGPVVRTTFSKAAALKDGVTVSVEKIVGLKTKARTPGEISGPAVAVTIAIKNGSSAAIDVGSTIVTLTGTKHILGQPTTSRPYRPFSGSIAPSASSTATYVFLLPKKDRASLDLSVEYLAGAPIAHFHGAAS